MISQDDGKGIEKFKEADEPGSRVNQLIGSCLVEAGLSFSSTKLNAMESNEEHRVWTLLFGLKTENEKNVTIKVILQMKHSILLSVLPFLRKTEERQETSLNALREWVDGSIQFVRIYGPTAGFPYFSFRSSIPTEIDFIGKMAVNAAFGSVMQAATELLNKFPEDFEFPEIQSLMT